MSRETRTNYSKKKKMNGEIIQREFKCPNDLKFKWFFTASTLSLLFCIIGFTVPLIFNFDSRIGVFITFVLMLSPISELVLFGLWGDEFTKMKQQEDK